MKKLVALALILTLGLFTAVGCQKPAEKKKVEEKKVEQKDAAKTPAPDAAKPTEEKK